MSVGFLFTFGQTLDKSVMRGREIQRKREERERKRVREIERERERE